MWSCGEERSVQSERLSREAVSPPRAEQRSTRPQHPGFWELQVQEEVPEGPRKTGRMLDTVRHVNLHTDLRIFIGSPGCGLDFVVFILQDKFLTYLLGSLRRIGFLMVTFNF